MKKLYTGKQPNVTTVLSIWLIIMLVCYLSGANAQCISLTTLGSASTQSFNTLANTGTTNNLTITGWFMTETGGGARDNEQYAFDDGGSNLGDTYSYGVDANSERALGGLRSGTLIPVIGVCFTNNTGSTITSLDINYFGEQWRIANSDAARDDRMDFQYSLNATDLTTGTWLDVNALDFTNPIKTAASAQLDGNDVANRTNIISSITSLFISSGTTFWIRWNDFDASGSDDGLAVDDFALTPQGGIVNLATLTTLTSSLNPSFTGNNVIFTATVTSGGNPVTLGTVTFSEGATILAANVALNGSGQASFNTSALTEGSHNITATYNGATGFNTSNGSIVQVVNNMTVVNGNSFCNEGVITLADGNTGGEIGTPGTPYPSNIMVSGLSGTIQSITVDVKGLTHDKPQDIDLLLVAPTGETFIIMAGVGGASFNNTNLTLSDAAASALSRVNAIPSGTYRPASYEDDSRNIFPAPAPAGPYNQPDREGTATFASVFNGLNPNGTWQLYATDDTTITVGSIVNGWCLNISTLAPCDITSVSFSDQQPCNDNGTMDQTDDYYTADVTVTFSNPPAMGLLELEQDGAVLDVVNVAVGSLVGNTHTFQNVRLKANGMVNAVEAQFSADQLNCVRTAQAPAVNSCSPICVITSISFSDQTTCNNNGSADTNDDYYTADVTVTFSNPPSMGLLELEQDGAVLDNNVNIAVGSLVGNTHTFQDVRLKANGMVNAVEAQFSADQLNCVRTAQAPAVNSCPCEINIEGATIDGNVEASTICSEEAFTLTVDSATSTGLADGDKIDWYYDSDINFTPGIEGTLLGSSMVMVTNVNPTRNTCTNIAAGEIAFVSFQSDDPDIFSFVALANIAEGVVINFTDNGWLSSGSFRTGEGVITWTAPVGGLPVGTVVTISADGGFTASVGSITTSGSAALSASGDQIISFCGTLAAPTKLLAGVQFGGVNWDANADDTNTSALPTGLMNGTTAVAVGNVDNGRFNCAGGIVSGTATAIATSINTSSNWTTSGTVLNPTVATCAYTVTGTSVLTISELEASIDDCGTFFIKGIINPLPTSCTAEQASTSTLQVTLLCPVAMLSGDATICQGDSATVTINITGAPANQNVSGNITNGMIDIPFFGMTDGGGLATIQIMGITQEGAYSIETILIGAACASTTVSGTATIMVDQLPVVTIGNQEPVVCSTRRLLLSLLQASITLDGQPFTGVWDVLEADSDGSFRDANDVVNNLFGAAVSFVPGVTDSARGYVTLILRSDDPDGPCPAVQASVRLMILRVNCGEFPWNGQ